MPVRELLPVLDSMSCCNPLMGDVMSQADAESVARSLKAVADPARLRILSMVAAHSDSEACVCDLQAPLGLSQPTVSHHLKVLVDAGFLTRTKRGTWAYYALVPGALDSVAGMFSTDMATATLISR